MTTGLWVNCTLLARQWTAPHHKSFITEVKCQHAAINPGHLQGGHFPLSCFTLSLRKLMHLPSFLQLPASYFISPLPSLTRAVLHDSSQKVEICADEAPWFIFAWQSSGELAKEHAIQTEWGKLSTPTTTTTPPRIQLHPADTYCFLVRIRHKNILIACLDSAAFVTSIAPALMSLFQQRIKFFWEEAIFAGRWNLWIQTDLWLIRPQIWRCPQTSWGKTRSHPPKQTSLHGLETQVDPPADSWWPRGACPTFHFTRPSLPYIIWIGQGAVHTKALCHGSHCSHSDTVRQSWWGIVYEKMTKVSLDTSKSKLQLLKSSEQM